MTFETFTLEQRPDLASRVHDLNGEAWPEFLTHAGLGHWSRLFDTFVAFQILFLDPDSTVISIGLSLPFVWDGTLDDLPGTIGTVMDRAGEDRKSGRIPNTLSAMAAIVSRGHQRRGLSAEILRAMRALAARHGMHSLVAPVRPTLKSAYPLTPFERYVEWKREDGTPFDPWMRVHHRLGAKKIKLMPDSLIVSGTIAEWEEWTYMSFPETGEYVVPGALQPITIDREHDEGRYTDPNIWMRHPVG